MCDLIHNVVRTFEKTENAVVQLDTHVVSVFLQAKRTEVEVFQPVIVELLGNCSLNRLECTISYDSIILQS